MSLPQPSLSAPTATGSAVAMRAAAPATAGLPVVVRRVGVLPWPDPVIDRVGHDPRSWYVETFWLPVLGPSSVLLLRHLAGRLEVEPDGFSVELEALARGLGLGPGLGKWGPVQRTLTRCASFGALRRWGADRVMVRRALPPLARHHLAHLPEALQQQHLAWQAEALVTAQRQHRPPQGRAPSGAS